MAKIYVENIKSLYIAFKENVLNSFEKNHSSVSCDLRGIG